MNFDSGDVLTRAWKITWKHRVLWIIGIVFGFPTSIMFPLMLSPGFLSVSIQDSTMDPRAVVMETSLHKTGMGVGISAPEAQFGCEAASGTSGGTSIKELK
jgi:hypothetical protein